MNPQQFMAESLRLVNEAVKLDTENKYSEALAMYMAAIPRFIHSIRCEYMCPTRAPVCVVGNLDVRECCTASECFVN